MSFPFIHETVLTMDITSIMRCIKLVKLIGNNVRCVLWNMGYNIRYKKIHNSRRKLSVSIPAYVMSAIKLVSTLHWVAPPTVKLHWSKNSLHIMVLIDCKCVLSHGHFCFHFGQTNWLSNKTCCVSSSKTCIVSSSNDL